MIFVRVHISFGDLLLSFMRSVAVLQHTALFVQQEIMHVRVNNVKFRLKIWNAKIIKIPLILECYSALEVREGNFTCPNCPGKI